jgi:hypothetical protein
MWCRLYPDIETHNSRTISKNVLGSQNVSLKAPFLAALPFGRNHTNNFLVLYGTANYYNYRIRSIQPLNLTLNQFSNLLPYFPIPKNILLHFPPNGPTSEELFFLHSLSKLLLCAT